MKIKQFVQNLFGVNTFIVWDENTKESLIIDPGSAYSEEEDELSGFIQSENLKLKYLLNTHCHIDHIFGNTFIKNKYNPIFIAPKGDIFLLDIMVEHAGEFGVTLNPSPAPDKTLDENELLSIGNIKITPISTPGHTPDGYCFYLKDEKICFTGDTLFNEGIGRTDLWGGDYSAILSSIKQKLFTLPEEVKIYPGHGEESSIGREKNNNPFIA